MDGLTLASVAAEVRKLTGGRVEKVQQPERDMLLLSIHKNGQGYKLLLSVSADNGRIQITSKKYENPVNAPMFCMLMRKRLSGAKLVSVEQPMLDRRVVLSFSAYNELGDNVVYSVICEIMGKHSNIIFVNENGVVIDAIKRIDESISNRVVLPGMPYEPPKTQTKLDPREADEADFLSVLSQNASAHSALSRAYFGLSPRVAEMLIDSFGKRSLEETASCLFAFYRDVRRDVFQNSADTDADGNIQNVYPFNYGLTKVTDINAALDKMYELKDQSEHIKRKYGAVKKVVSNNIARCERRLGALQAAVPSDGELETMRRYGELLTANLFKLRSNAGEAVLTDYYSPGMETVKIPLDIKKTPADNAKEYFREYRKGKTAQRIGSEQIAKTLEELEYLETLDESLECCESSQDVQEITRELTEQGYIRDKNKTPKKRKQAETLPPMLFAADDGTEILVGKNNRQNDELTLRTAAKSDWWLHVKDMPGSHVIVRCREELSSELLLTAANLAACYSKAKNGENVPVDYTRVRYVKKPSGAKPGMVIYTNQNTVFVTPNQKEAAKRRKRI